MGTPRRVERWSEFGLVCAIVLLGIALTFASDTVLVRGTEANNFLRVENLLANVLVPMSWVAILALGATVVIVSGGIDVSVGSTFALAALATAAVTQQLDVDAPASTVLPLALGVSLGVGALAGLVNGALIVGLRLHPFIVTLGTLSIFRGLALVSVAEKTLPGLGRSLPSALTEHGVGARVDFAGAFLQPVPIVVMLVALAAAWIFLARTVWGRSVYALGGNEEAARYAGIAVGRVKVGVYVLAGLAAGLAGFVSVGFYQSANTQTGEGLELSVIAAAVVGGASLSGGRGTALGALLGALLIKLIENGIDVVRRVDFGLFELTVSKEHSKIILGLAILVAVAVDRFAEARRAR